ncbi:hypothetical protein B4U80_04933 [Leptotrombidium deliense]|uniref:Phospholipase A2-like domain-containing protein n=1 Tax=Leptotrombidium deliense TaxID=299467 RepID=A0A443RSQ1_9ACAR|nr:hypothetical protein B4U80_04933 [Leptotrombidium deliense]
MKDKLKLFCTCFIHLPGYNYCGPGTNLDYNLKNNIKPVNRVDEACKQHDIRYSSDIPRREADQILLDDINEINNPTFKEFYAIVIIKIVFFFKMKYCNYF